MPAENRPPQLGLIKLLPGSLDALASTLALIVRKQKFPGMLLISSASVSTDGIQ